MPTDAAEAAGPGKAPGPPGAPPLRCSAMDTATRATVVIRS
jgi:hypothetical protein